MKIGSLLNQHRCLSTGDRRHLLQFLFTGKIAPCIAHSSAEAKGTVSFAGTGSLTELDNLNLFHRWILKKKLRYLSLDWQCPPWLMIPPWWWTELAGEKKTLAGWQVTCPVCVTQQVTNHKSLTGRLRRKRRRRRRSRDWFWLTCRACRMNAEERLYVSDWEQQLIPNSD